MAPLLHVSTICHFLVPKVNFKSFHLLSPGPFMAFDIDSQYAETESRMQVIEEQSNFFNNLSVIGGKKYLIVREKNNATYALQNNCVKLYRLKTKCFCWLFSDLLQEN